MDTKKLCKIICALCLGLSLVAFLFTGNFSGSAITSIAVQLLFCGGMMFAMMKMMGCKNSPAHSQNNEQKQTDN
ncbi:DUF2933 domain-containing protein [Vibrio paucivorans]